MGTGGAHFNGRLFMVRLNNRLLNSFWRSICPAYVWNLAWHRVGWEASVLVFSICGSIPLSREHLRTGWHRSKGPADIVYHNRSFVSESLGPFTWYAGPMNQIRLVERKKEFWLPNKKFTQKQVPNGHILAWNSPLLYNLNSVHCHEPILDTHIVINQSLRATSCLHFQES